MQRVSKSTAAGALSTFELAPFIDTNEHVRPLKVIEVPPPLTVGSFSKAVRALRATTSTGDPTMVLITLNGAEIHRPAMCLTRSRPSLRGRTSLHSTALAAVGIRGPPPIRQGSRFVPDPG